MSRFPRAASAISSEAGVVPFSARACRGGDGVRLALAGELDLATAAAFDQAMTEAFASRPAGDVVLDLRELTFMDSSGIHVLIAFQRRAAEEGRALAIVPGCDAVTRLLELCGLGPKLPRARP